MADFSGSFSRYILSPISLTMAAGKRLARARRYVASGDEAGAFPP